MAQRQGESPKYLKVFEQRLTRDCRKLVTDLRPRGGRKLALQNGKVEGSEVGKTRRSFWRQG